MTAVVGPSGAGKTTLTRSIARFFDTGTGTGTVRVGGADVRELTSEDLMAQPALVFQDVFLFNDTLKASIRVGRPDAAEEEVREAARLAGVDELVARLPQGWATRVGEGGLSLSGGGPARLRGPRRPQTGPDRAVGPPTGSARPAACDGTEPCPPASAALDMANP